MFETLKDTKIIVICRRLYGEDLLKTAEALVKGGIRFVEVTYDQADPECADRTAEAIRMLLREFDGTLYVGAGTVLTKEQVAVTKEAGGRFTISPNVSEKVIKASLEAGMEPIPGAMTPSEIVSAHEYGAKVVKLFPAGTLGLKYFKDILAPISHVPLLATGGVNEENFGEFLRLGAAGAGISGRLTDRKCINDGDFGELERRAKAFCEIARGTGK